MESNNETKCKKQKIWRDDQECKSLFMLQKMNDWELETMLNSLSKINGDEYNWDQEKLGIKQDAWNKVIHSEIQPILVFAHPLIIQKNTKRFMYYRHVAMISQKFMSNIGLQIQKFEETLIKTNDIRELYARCRIINNITSNLVLHMDTVTLKAIIICLGMGAGTQAHGSWHNKKGHNIEKAVWEKIKTWFKEKEFRIEKIDDGLFMHNNLCYKLSSDPDIGVYNDGRLIASIEIKGGIDPAAALERGGAVQKSFTRKDTQIKICVARLTAVTNEFREHMKTNGVELFIYEELDSDIDKIMELLCLKCNKPSLMLRERQ